MASWRLWCSCSCFFTLLFAFYLFRPLREALASQQSTYGDLFLASLGVLTIGSVCYGVGYLFLSRTILTTGTFIFFILSVLCFAFIIPNELSKTAPWIAATYFVWVNFFSLFSVSCYWSVLTDTVPARRSAPEFGYISAAGTAGGMLGSLVTAQASAFVSAPVLLLIGAGFLTVAAVSLYLLGTKSKDVADQPDSLVQEPCRPTSSESRFSVIWADSRFAWLIVFVAMQTAGDTWLYIFFNKVVKGFIEDPSQRIRFFAMSNFMVQSIMILPQGFGVARLVRHFGAARILGLLPIGYLVVGASLFLAPRSLYLTMAGWAICRIAALGMTSILRECAFTLLLSQHRYGPKNFLDTVVVRFISFLCATVSDHIGQFRSLSPLLVVILPGMAVIWAISGMRALKGDEELRRG